MNLPPRMVSRKWTCQLSLLFTLPIEAAMPPSAMTVCALPNSDLQMIAVRRPGLVRLDRGAQPRPAGADDDDVEVVALVLTHVGAQSSVFGGRRVGAQLRKRRSLIQPADTDMT